MSQLLWKLSQSGLLRPRSHRHPEQFHVVPRPPFLLAGSVFSKSLARTEEYAHVLDNLCSLKDVSTLLTSRLTSCPLVGFIFGLFHDLRSPSYRKLIEHSAPSHSGLPHECIEQRHCLISAPEKFSVAP